MLATQGLILWATVTARLVLTGEGQVSRLHQVHDIYSLTCYIHVYMYHMRQQVKRIVKDGSVLYYYMALNFIVSSDRIDYKRVGIAYIICFMFSFRQCLNQRLLIHI